MHTHTPQASCLPGEVLFSVLGTEFRIKTVWLKFMIDFHISVETKDFANMPTALLCAFLNTFLII